MLLRILARSILAVSFSTPAFASDGVLEINQACALSAAGCFPGDIPLGFPVEITQRGSYRLTGDLDLSLQSPNTSAVQISAQVVTLDLGGFSIRGSTTCSGIPTASCTNAGSTGVGVLGGNFVTVRNGSVSNMASDGVRVFGASTLEDLHVFSNGGSGIKVASGGGSLVQGNLAVSNGGDGIDAIVEATLDRNTAVGNHSAGLRILDGGVATRNVLSRNGEQGASFGSASVSFADNTFTGNTGGSVAGGRAPGGNSCDDFKCTRTGAKRFYLTRNSQTGEEPHIACAPGFHMASLWEILDPSNLTYDAVLGLVSDDSGAGPPSATSVLDAVGWVRTG